MSPLLPGKHHRQQKSYPSPLSIVRIASGITIGTHALLFAVQIINVLRDTPRLPPPNRFSGYNFVKDGLCVMAMNNDCDDDIDDDNNDDEDDDNYDDIDDEDGGGIDNDDRNNGKYTTPPFPVSSEKRRDNQENEFRLLLLGDSPVEGIGCTTHRGSFGGRTALSLSRYLGDECDSDNTKIGDGKSNNDKNGRVSNDVNDGRPIRFWSIGKSGLTASGICDKMVPLIKDLEPTSPSLRRGHRLPSSSESNEKKTPPFPVDLVVISCGVNDVLSGRTIKMFERDLKLLLDSVRECTVLPDDDSCRPPPVIFLGLPDFASMPFLPYYPLGAFLGWRGSLLQRAMENFVLNDRRRVNDDDKNNNNNKDNIGRNIAIAHIPSIQAYLDEEKEAENDLKVENFFAKDGFHPAGFGTKMLGDLVTEVYAKDIILRGSSTDDGW